MDEEKLSCIKQHAKVMRRHALDMALSAGGSASHFGGGMSVVDITATLYFGVMNTIEKGMQNPTRDRFILSKGHGVLGYYSALAEAGFVSVDELKTFEKDDTDLPGHPVINRSKGVEFTNGSLAMGLSLAIGVAIASKKRKYDNKIYVLVGDGECNEGSIWEGFMSAAHFKLDNLIVIVDKNNLQLDGKTSDVMDSENLADKIKSFGWNVIECDGHNIEELYNAFTANFSNDRPKAVIADTVKGKGFSFSENKNEWHHAVLTQNQYELALQELELQ